MLLQAKLAAPPLPPRPRLRPSPPPHTAQSFGHHLNSLGTQDMVADQLARIMQNASGCQIKTKTGRGSLVQNKENCGIPLETAVELLGIKEGEGAQDDNVYHCTEVTRAHVKGPRHPLPEKPTRIGEIKGAQSMLGGLLEFETQKSEELGFMIASTGQLDGCWNIGANGLIGLQAPSALPLHRGCTYSTVTHIHSGKYRGDQSNENRPLPALPASKQPKKTLENIGYVINSNGEYLKEVANHYNRSFGKVGKVFIKIHGIDGLNMPEECGIGSIRNEGRNADRYVYIVLECDGQNISSKRVAAEPGCIHVGEEFVFSVQAGCNLIIKLAVAPSFPATRTFTRSTSSDNPFNPLAGRNQHPEGKASGETSNSISTQNVSKGDNIPQMNSSGSAIFSAGGSVAQICLKLDGTALAGLSIPKSTAGFQQSWPLTRECTVLQEHVKPSYEQKPASRSLRKQWQKLKRHSVISRSTSVSTLKEAEDDVDISQRKEVVVGNVKASVVVWPYSGDWTPSGFDECVRILSCDGVSNLHQLVKGWSDLGNEWIVRNPNVDLTGVLEAASVLGNLMVLGNASVRVAGSLFWKRRSFALHPPHLLSLPLSDQLPTHIHQAFDLRRSIAIEAPFDTPIQDIQDGLWHPTANAFRICFRKSAMDFKQEETVEFSVDSLATAKEWVNLLRDIVGRLQETEF